MPARASWRPATAAARDLRAGDRGSTCAALAGRRLGSSPRGNRPTWLPPRAVFASGRLARARSLRGGARRGASRAHRSSREARPRCSRGGPGAVLTASPPPRRCGAVPTSATRTGTSTSLAFRPVRRGRGRRSPGRAAPHDWPGSKHASASEVTDVEPAARLALAVVGRGGRRALARVGSDGRAPRPLARRGLETHRTSLT
jgi:hypothetical protein